MLLQLASCLSMLQLCGRAVTLPPQQQPLLETAKGVQAVQAELKKAEIIPTVIDDFLPSLLVDVGWKKKQAKLGNTIKPKHLQEHPIIALHDITAFSKTATKGMTYVVTLTDPDAPSRDDPEWSEMCHWITTITTLSEETYSILPLPEHGLTEPTTATNTKSDDVVEYKPPGPPPKTGKHRYVFLVFAAKNGTTEPLHLSKPKERQHWGTGKERGGVRNWAFKNGLVPVAANFIYAKNKKQ